MASQAPQHAALTVIDGQLGGSYGACGPGLHLDKAERGSVPRNQVEVAGGAGRMPVSGDYDIASAQEPEEGSALPSKPVLRWGAGAVLRRVALRSDRRSRARTVDSIRLTRNLSSTEAILRRAAVGRKKPSSPWGHQSFRGGHAGTGVISESGRS
jgi:hypothetical protein